VKNVIISVRLFVFLRAMHSAIAIAECIARHSHRLSVRPSVCLSVRLSHSWSVSKRCKLKSQNLHHGVPQGL